VAFSLLLPTQLLFAVISIATGRRRDDSASSQTKKRIATMATD
jgi:hypothetical protein